MQNAHTEILNRFIADETAAIPSNDRGAYFPSHHHRIKPLVARAHRLLPETGRIDLYFHLLRLDACPAVRAAAEFPLLVQAYARICPLFDRGYPACSMARPKGLFLFGADDHGPLIEEAAVTHQEYLDHAAFWRYADSFWHMPGMLKKQSKFAELAKDDALVARALRVLTRTRPAEDLTGATCLWFWALVLLVIQHPTAAKTAVEWMADADVPADDRDFYRRNLVRYLQASKRFDLTTHRGLATD